MAKTKKKKAVKKRRKKTKKSIKKKRKLKSGTTKKLSKSKNKLKKIEAYWNNECAEHPSNNHCKIFCN